MINDLCNDATGSKMRILALEPYYGGSHKAFLDGWIEKSKHSWKVFSLEPYKWKWRMRHSAVTFAGLIKNLSVDDFDVIFCSDMLNLAEFIGLLPLLWQRLPRVVYFHENQLTYPTRFENERDYQFVFTNLTTALAADSVWFNSAFHRDEFLNEMAKFLKRMPDYQPIEVVDEIRNKSIVCWPGVKSEFAAKVEKDATLKILWVGRWEHDKKPEDFFEALKILKKKTHNFKINVIGEQFRDSPEVFGWAREYFADHIERWGYQSSREQYLQTLAQSDVVVSTAGHEFFGIAMIEAILAGALPVLPERLAYPEVMGLAVEKKSAEFFYDGSVKSLAKKLIQLVHKKDSGDLWAGDDKKAIRLVERFRWQNHTKVLDDEIDKLRQSRG